MGQLGRLTEATPPDPAPLAEQVFEALCDNGYEVLDGVIARLKPAIGPDGLALLKTRFEQLAEQPIPLPPRQEWQQVGWVPGPREPLDNPLAVAECSRKARRAHEVIDWTSGCSELP
jgi:hypothetical protein